jgi:DNA-binding NarL/FixJ family response regulator
VAHDTDPSRTCVLLWRGAGEGPSENSAGPVLRAIEAGGGEVVAHVDRWAQLLVVALEHDAEVVVLDLAMSGRAGVRLIGALRELTPDAHIVVVSELRAIDVASLEAGADVVVTIDDLRPLSAAVRGPATRDVEVARHQVPVAVDERS